MSQEPQLRILIIGGGVAGPALAQLLHTNKNVRCSVFDRDASVTSRFHKWSITLSTCLSVVGPKLGPRLGPFTKASSTRDAGIVDTGAILDWKTGDIRVKWGRETPGPGYFILANRQRVREYFTRGIEVSWNKRFVRYEEDADGVTAFFDDGTQARGDILVGVDGSNSRVRAQLLEGITDTATKPRPYAIVQSTVEVTAEQHEYLSRYSDSFSFTMDNGSLLHTGLVKPLAPASEYDYSKDKGPAHYYFHLYIPDQEAATLNPDNTTPDGKPFWTQITSAKELRERALDHTKHWKGPVREIVELAKDENMILPPFLLRDWCPPENLVLPRGRVTLMGDAAHQMIPFRGTGANTSILDAIELAERIEAVTNASPKPGMDVLQTALDEYWTQILPRGRETVLTSRHALERDPTGDMTVQMIAKGMSGGGPPPGFDPPGGPPSGPPGPPAGAPSLSRPHDGPSLSGRDEQPPSGPPREQAELFDGTESDARRGLMWRG